MHAEPATPAPRPHQIEGQGVRSDWYRELARYEKPNTAKAVWQLVNTFVPFLVLWVAMVMMLKADLPYWTTFPFIVINGLLLVRIFIFFHDCCHGSFFGSRNANRILGYICGTLVFTPFEDWRQNHAGHHATAGDLDRRGLGDIWTMTVSEYLAASPYKRFTYRAFRHPLILFVIGPPIVFLMVQRFPHKNAKKRERNSVRLTNLLVAVVALSMIWGLGFKHYFMLQFPTITIAAAIGIWMFYVQHQFEKAYWANADEWDPAKAALEGSSYYKLPKILQWFTGNIGLHHLHHLRPRIPNYNLQRCYDEIPALQQVEPLTISRSFRSIFMNLIDESNKTLISFRAAKRYRPQPQPRR